MDYRGTLATTPQVLKNDAKQKKFKPIINVGSNKTVAEASSIRAGGTFIKKKEFCVSNVSANYSATDMAKYVQSLGLQVQFCNKVTTRYDSKDCISFRICICANNSEHPVIFMKAENWPCYIIVRQWVFKQKDVNTLTESQQTVLKNVVNDSNVVTPGVSATSIVVDAVLGDK
jgi:hypothetical protein